MSTQPPHNPVVHWDILYEGGTVTHSFDGPWSTISTLKDIDGTMLSCTDTPVSWLRVHIPGEGKVVLDIPATADCFALARYTQGAYTVGEECEPQWLYTCFGYVLPEYVMLLKVTSIHPWFLTLPRPLVFPW